MNLLWQKQTDFLLNYVLIQLVLQLVVKVRRRRKYASKSREYQWNLVVIDFPGKTPHPVQVLHDYDKVYEGALVFDSYMTEDCIREEVASLIKRKESYVNDFSEVGPEDFQFVKCVNRRVRVPDGKATYDCEGLKDLYRGCNIYVRLTKSFTKHRVSKQTPKCEPFV